MKMCGKKCSGCGEYISGEYINALDKEWHKSCFVCTVCHQTAKIMAGILNKRNRIARDHSREDPSWFVTTCLIVNSIIITPLATQLHLKDSIINSQRKVRENHLHSNPSHPSARSLICHLLHLLPANQKNLIKDLTYPIALPYRERASNRPLRQDHPPRCAINAIRLLTDPQQVRLAMTTISITFSASIVTAHYRLVYLVSLYFCICCDLYVFILFN